MVGAQHQLRERLLLAEKGQDAYRPNNEVAHHIGGVVLGSLVGITSVGKSHLIPFVISQGGSEFSEVGNRSTRAKRPSDPESFRGGVPVEEFLDRIEHGEMVNYVVHPSGDLYGTDASSYTTDFVLLPTLTSALEQLQTMGCFKRIVPIGFVTNAETWTERLNDKLNDPKIEARMREALDCIGWLQDHSRQIPILENKTGEEKKTAQMIIDIMKDPPQPHTLNNLERVDMLLPQLAAVATEHLRQLALK
jgi:hypothetical protein